ncbi:MAG TPA: hypothetical protein VGL77_13950 [Armatimonadota bacterium]
MTDIQINCQQTTRPLPHFWRSIGFMPATLLLTPIMRQTITYVGALPQRAIEHVRIHFLLDLLKVERHDAVLSNYDWSELDEGIDLLVNNGLKPFFELMGNPSGAFSDFNDDDQLTAWRDMVRDLAEHLEGRYGVDEVRSWYFEGWNEPDASWWHQWPQEIPYLRYYDACSEGLRLADPALRFGGPGGCQTLSPLVKALFAHCDSGINTFTGESGVRLDFISVHEKAADACLEDLNPNTRELLNKELKAVEYLRAHHPALARLPLMNNECDPQIGWVAIHTWHAGPYYPAVVSKILNQHLQVLIDDYEVDYPVLSSDNGFIGTWGNRTLLTTFGSEAAFEPSAVEYAPFVFRSCTARAPEGSDTPLGPETFALIKKPILNLMGLLALLGETRCAVTGASDPFADFGVMATRRDDEQIAVLVYHSADRVMSSGCDTFNITLDDVPFTEGTLAHYRIDETHNNPYRRWEEMGAPYYPTPEQLAAMRDEQETTLLEEPSTVVATDGRMTLSFSLPLPGVSLLLLSRKPDEVVAESIPAIHFARYAGLTEGPAVMLSWVGVTSHTLRTYEVLYAPTTDARMTRVNARDILASAYLYTPGSAEGVSGVYQIRALDYWGNVCGLSPVLSFSCPDDTAPTSILGTAN